MFTTLTAFAAGTLGISESAMAATGNSAQAPHHQKARHKKVHKKPAKRVTVHKAKHAKVPAKHQTRRTHARHAKTAGSNAHPVGS